MSTAILLIAHGSRRADANADLLSMAELLAPRVSGSMIEIAYLELAEPTIEQGLAACVRRGASEVRMLPYFLSAGAHVSEDLERRRQEFIAAHPQVGCILCPPLGLHPGVVEALADRVRERMNG